jgi:hypothetical protein
MRLSVDAFRSAGSRLSAFAGRLPVGPLAGRLSTASLSERFANRPTRFPGGRLSRRGRIGASVGTLALVMGGIVVLPAAEASADPCNPVVNPIACENSKTGSPASEWDITGVGDTAIQGFATDISVNVGGQISFKIKTTASSYTIDIYRLGWYGGDGARHITSVTPSATLPQIQPSCVTDATTELYDCGNWGVSATWPVPSTSVSGVYIALLHRAGGTDSSQIPFIVRDDSSHSGVFFQTSDTTWHAYNDYGGSDYYTGAANGRAYQLSYNRPFATRGLASGRDYLFSNEYPTIRFLERNGYDVSYTTGVDSARFGDLIKNHKIFLSVGHDEYWSGPQRANVEAARDAGVNLAFFSGNEVYWKTRWENSRDGSNTAYRTQTSYKETWANAKIDPSSEWTGTWRDPRFTPPSNGNRPENALTGTMFMANSDDLALTVPAAQGKLRLWRSSNVATRAASSLSTTLSAHTVGYESDEDLDNGFRPAGLIDLSTTTGSTPEYLRDFGSVVTAGTTTHHLTMYKATTSGALVFGAGTIQWGWGLDDQHDGTSQAADLAIQQATINLFADMGVQPTTRMSTLAAASASTDTTAPTVAFSSPAANATVTNGTATTVTGTATDTGGQVGGVEVSTDGGTTWHPATGTTSWSYTFYPTGVSTQTLQARATDDSGNIGTAVSRQLTTSGANNMFGTRVPADPAVTDPDAVEVGVKFVPQTAGLVSGIRFYKGSGNTGTHTGSLWSATGTQLATGTFSGESSTGWQTLTFSTAVAVNPNTTYIASYYAPNGHYAADELAFSSLDWTAGPLVAPRSETSAGNGVFKYATGGGFPTDSFHDANYYVDVTFLPSASSGPSMVSAAPITNSTGVSLSVHPSAVFSKSLNPSSVVFTLKTSGGATVAGSAAYDDSTKTVTFTPSANLAATTTYTATVQANDTSGNSGTGTWTFTTDVDSSVSRLFAVNAVPTNTSENDSGAVELGVKFTPAVDGTVLGVRFYQGTGNTGTQRGSLWSSSGTQLATVNFTSTSGTGWQTALFSSPVSVTGGTTYTASYFAPNGHYSADSNYFSSTYTNTGGNLSAPSSSNGVYKYGSAGGFPTSSFQSTNYWVDPLFKPSAASPSPSPSGSPSPTPSPTPTDPPSGTATLFASTATPTSASWNDPGAVEVGVKFTSDVNGSVTGVRFYKGTSNTGTHTGSLWTSTGTLLATATFSGESASGWQTVYFSTPVAITTGTTYVVSYHTNVGYYAVNVNAFNGTGLDRAPLHIPASGAVYRYGSGGTFPSSSANHNYWVDVMVTPS